MVYYLTMTNKTVDNPATIADVNKTVKSSEKVLRTEILRIEERLEGVEEKLSTKIDKVLTAISNFAGRVDNLETENEIGTGQIHELRDVIKDHTEKIAKLESVN